MKSIKFDVQKYVESRLVPEGEDALSLEEYDDLPRKKESLTKNVNNILKQCTQSEYFESFSFEKDVLEYFPLNNFEDKSIGEFLDHILAIKENGNFIGNKLISNLSKISVDNKDTNAVDKWRNFDFFNVSKMPSSLFSTKVEALKESNRMIVRRNPRYVKKLIETIEDFLSELKKENIITDLPYVIDYVSDVILQIVNYWVITIADLDFEKKIQISKKLEHYLSSFEKSVIKLKKERQFTTNFEKSISTFIAFLDRRNYYGEYLSILSKLEEEQKNEPNLFSLPLKQYRVKKQDNVIPEKLKEIITEGASIDEFDAKLEKTKIVIDIFSRSGGRIASSSCALDLKVYFREIYISDSSYKRQALTIIRKYLKLYNESRSVDSFEKASEYMFLREKISRGYFRETDDLQLYVCKNRIQKKLYEVLISIILTYDYESSINLLLRLVQEFIPACFVGIDDLLEENNISRIFLKKHSMTN